MGEIKQTNFRIDMETADKFRSLCDEMGLNQAQGFDHIMQIVELNRAKVGIEGRLTEITTFEEYVKKIMEAYLLSLEIAQNTEERVREDYKTDIKLRDNALKENEAKILERDEKIAQLTVEAQEAQKIAKEAVKTAENATKQAESAKQIAEEKEKVNDMLSSKLAEAEEKLAGYDELKFSKEELQKQLMEMHHKADILEVQLQNSYKQNESVSQILKDTELKLKESTDSVAELNGQIKLLQRDVEEQKRIMEQRLNEQIRASEQAQELAVERAIAKAQKDMQEEITKLRDEKTKLEVKIELYQEQTELKKSVSKQKKQKKEETDK